MICYQATTGDTHTLARCDALRSIREEVGPLLRQWTPLPKHSTAMHAAINRILKALFLLNDESLLAAFPEGDSMKNTILQPNAALHDPGHEGRDNVASRSADQPSFAATTTGILPGGESLQDGDENRFPVFRPVFHI